MIQLKINAIAGVTSQSNITARKISIAKDEIQAKKFFSFTEANDAKIDRSAFSINHSIALDQRFYFNDVLRVFNDHLIIF
jgi:hypothetical protein